MRNPVMWFLNRYDTNQAVQSLKMAKAWKFVDLESRGFFLSVAKIKALISFAVMLRS